MKPKLQYCESVLCGGACLNGWCGRKF